MLRLLLSSIVFLTFALLILGCQPQAERAQTYLATPIATTQPGQPSAPTHGQVITGVVDTVAPVLGPWGVVLSAAATGAMLVIQTLAANKKRNAQTAAIGTAVDVVADVKETVDAIAANTPVHPSAVVTKPTVK